MAMAAIQVWGVLRPWEEMLVSVGQHQPHLSVVDPRLSRTAVMPRQPRAERDVPIVIGAWWRGSVRLDGVISRPSPTHLRSFITEMGAHADERGVFSRRSVLPMGLRPGDSYEATIDDASLAGLGLAYGGHGPL